ncbi:MAG TPA: hypothetical protein VKR54_01395 [Candidatus Babeliales bacterium]|jgi:hypothetical protein|nr:hypothetical protein [Candidatus Babeliales bacterium]
MLKTKTFLPKITPQYIINKAGKKTSVILDIHEFENLLEHIEDIYFASIAQKALQKEKEFITHNDVKKKIDLLNTSHENSDIKKLKGYPNLYN